MVVRTLWHGGKGRGHYIYRSNPNTRHFRLKLRLTQTGWHFETVYNFFFVSLILPLSIRSHGCNSLVLDPLGINLAAFTCYLNNYLAKASFDQCFSILQLSTTLFLANYFPPPTQYTCPEKKCSLKTSFPLNQRRPWIAIISLLHKRYM